MRTLALLSLLAMSGLSACHETKKGDAVREAYDNKADAVEEKGAQQPNAMAREIYQDHADALREEGKDREKGMEGKQPSAGPSGVGKSGSASSSSQS